LVGRFAAPDDPLRLGKVGDQPVGVPKVMARAVVAAEPRCSRTRGHERVAGAQPLLSEGGDTAEPMK
jgi:hypothetical protein